MLIFGGVVSNCRFYFITYYTGILWSVCIVSVSNFPYPYYYPYPATFTTQGAARRNLQEASPCLCGTCGTGVCTFNGSGANKAISFAIKWIDDPTNAPATLFYKFKNGGNCVESTECIITGEDTTYFITNDSCGKKGEAPPHEISPNLMVYETSELSNLIGSLHASCSDPLGIGTVFGSLKLSGPVLTTEMEGQHAMATRQESLDQKASQTGTSHATYKQMIHHINQQWTHRKW